MLSCPKRGFLPFERTVAIHRELARIDPRPTEFATWISTYFNRQYDKNLGLNQVHETPELPLLMYQTAGPFGDGTYVIGLGDADVDAAIAKRTPRRTWTSASSRCMRRSG